MLYSCCSVLLLISLMIVSTVSGQRDRCGYLTFDPEQVPVHALGHSETYVFTNLPLSSCGNVALKYINYCFQLARPRTSPGVEMIAEVVVLSPTPTAAGDQYYVEGIVPIVAETSYCDGSTVQFQAWSLCCISRLIADHLNFRLAISSGKFSHLFGFRGPDAEGIAAYVPVGYSDFRIVGYVNTDRPVQGTNYNSRPSLNPGSPRLPMLSFTQSPACYGAVSPCSTETTPAATTSVDSNSTAVNLTGSSSSTYFLAKTTESSSTNVLATVVIAVTSLPVVIPNIVAAIAVLTILLIVFVAISIVLGIMLVHFVQKRNTIKGATETSKGIQDPLNSEPVLLDPKQPPVPDDNSRYSLLSRSPPTQQSCFNSDSQMSMEGYNKLQKWESCGPCAPQSLSSPYELVETKEQSSSTSSMTGISKSVENWHGKSIGSMKTNPIYGQKTVSAIVVSVD